MKRIFICRQTCIALLCTACSSSIFASGFRLPEVSIAGTGLSNAMVANPDLPGALPYNPAIMAFQQQGEVVAGVIFIQPDISVSPLIGTAGDSQGDDRILVPNLFVAKHIDSKWSWGIGINAPFGLETKWKDETFAAYSGLTDAFEPEHSKIEMLNINPNVAYQIDANTSVAFGIDNYRVLDLIFNTQALEISGDGQDYGWNVGLLHTQNNWSVGLSYRSSVKVDVNGTVDATAVGSTKSDAKAKVEFPSLLQIGGRYKVNNKLAIELDVEKTGWSSFDTVEIEHGSPGIPNPINGDNNWDDAMAYRLGATYELSSIDQLRAGYSLDKTPSNDEFFSARVPGNDRQTLSLGFAHKRADWTVELAYMYVKANDRKVAVGGAYDGTYKLSAHLFGVGLNTQF